MTNKDDCRFHDEVNNSSEEILILEERAEDDQQSDPMDLTMVSSFSPDERNMLSEPKPPRYYGQVGELRSVQEISQKYRHVFSKFPCFNAVQSKVMDDVLYSGDPVVVSAPTGSGKTAIFELAIIQLLMKLEDLNYQGEFKIVYIAPVKALCNERLLDWHPKFGSLGVTCIVVTGDSDKIDYTGLIGFNLIITTPEKWDSLTRKWTDNKKLMQIVKLFLIDEVHLLNEEDRGPTLEVIVSRMKTIEATISYEKSAYTNIPLKLRFLAASATIPNCEDIAEWLGSRNKPAKFYKIDEDLRPVKLKKIVLGYAYDPKFTPFKFDLSLNYKLKNVILQYSEGKSTLIFCNTRKGVEMTSATLLQEITLNISPQHKSTLIEAAASMADNKMRAMLQKGVGCHHAGMSYQNRLTIEGLFREGVLPILVTTSTLAMGINLPAHLVIVKNTQQYQNGGYKDYSESTILQMIGRAGRPQYDTSATAVIMTRSNDRIKYEKLLSGQELIESSLHRHLVEHINAEVVLHTITDIAVALDWLRSTFLYVRACKNPKHYNIPTSTIYKKEKIEKKLQEMCQIEINALARRGMLQIDQDDAINITPTENGILMARYYIAFDTMKLFLEIKGSESLSEILTLISKCKEFSSLRLRVNDKKTLNALNKSKNDSNIRFTLPGKIKTSDMKVNCIIQSVFGCLPIQDPALNQDALNIIRIGERVSLCLVEYLMKKDKCFTALVNSTILAKCFHAKLWENSLYVSRQLDKIGPVLASALVKAGKTSFSEILNSNARELERILNRSAPMGDDIINFVKQLPEYEITAKPPNCDGSRIITITITLKNHQVVSQHCSAGTSDNMVLLVGDSEENQLLAEKFTHIYMIQKQKIVKEVEAILEIEHTVNAFLISENWVGLDHQLTIKVPFGKRPVYLPQDFTNSKNFSGLGKQFIPQKTRNFMYNKSERYKPEPKKGQKMTHSLKQSTLDQFAYASKNKLAADCEYVTTLPHYHENDEILKRNQCSNGEELEPSDSDITIPESFFDATFDNISPEKDEIYTEVVNSSEKYEIIEILAPKSKAKLPVDVSQTSFEYYSDAHNSANSDEKITSYSEHNQQNLQTVSEESKRNSITENSHVDEAIINSNKLNTPDRYKEFVSDRAQTGSLHTLEGNGVSNFDIGIEEFLTSSSNQNTSNEIETKRASQKLTKKSLKRGPATFLVSDANVFGELCLNKDVTREHLDKKLRSTLEANKEIREPDSPENKPKTELFTSQHRSQRRNPKQNVEYENYNKLFTVSNTVIDFNHQLPDNNRSYKNYTFLDNKYFPLTNCKKNNEILSQSISQSEVLSPTINEDCFSAQQFSGVVSNSQCQIQPSVYHRNISNSSMHNSSNHIFDLDQVNGSYYPQTDKENCYTSNKENYCAVAGQLHKQNVHKESDRQNQFEEKLQVSTILRNHQKRNIPETIVRPEQVTNSPFFYYENDTLKESNTKQSSYTNIPGNYSQYSNHYCHHGANINHLQNYFQGHCNCKHQPQHISSYEYPSLSEMPLSQLKRDNSQLHTYGHYLHPFPHSRQIFGGVDFENQESYHINNGCGQNGPNCNATTSSNKTLYLPHSYTYPSQLPNEIYTERPILNTHFPEALSQSSAYTSYNNIHNISKPAMSARNNTYPRICSNEHLYPKSSQTVPYNRPQEVKKNTLGEQYSDTNNYDFEHQEYYQDYAYE